MKVSLLNSLGNRVALVICILLCSVNIIPQSTIGNSSSSQTAAIYGRVWGPTRAPVQKGYVLVTDLEITKLFGESLTLAKPGPDNGSYQITNLPANKELLVFVFHNDIPDFIEQQKIILNENEYKHTNLLLSISFKGPGLIKNFILRFPTLINQAIYREQAEAIIRRLRTLQSISTNDDKYLIHSTGIGKINLGEPINIVNAAFDKKLITSEYDEGGEGVNSYYKKISSPNSKKSTVFIVSRFVEFVDDPKKHEQDPITYIVIKDPKFMTQNGIHVGSTYSDFCKSYPTHKIYYTGSSFTLKLPGVKYLEFNIMAKRIPREVARKKIIPGNMKIDHIEIADNDERILIDFDRQACQ